MYAAPRLFSRAASRLLSAGGEFSIDANNTMATEIAASQISFGRVMRNLVNHRGHRVTQEVCRSSLFSLRPVSSCLLFDFSVRPASNDAFTFLNRDRLSRRHVGKLFGSAARPLHLKHVYLRG